MRCSVMKTTPALHYAVAVFDSKKQAREYLRAILKGYKDDYRRGQNVRDNCYWRGKDAIVVHAINNDGTVSGDRVEYVITEY